MTSLTVGQLLTILHSHDRSTPVLVDGYEAGLCKLKPENIRTVRFSSVLNQPEIMGDYEEINARSEGGEDGVVLGRG